MTKKVIVEAVGIQAISTGRPGSEPGDLEIFGQLGAWAVFLNSSGQPEARIEHLLMNNTDEDSAQSITVGATLHVGAKTPVMEIFDNEEVWVGGHLTEFDDPGLNDFIRTPDMESVPGR